MRTIIAPALIGLAAALIWQPAPAGELRLRELHDQRLIIEGPSGGTRGYLRATPSGRVIIESRWGRRVGSIRPLPGGGRAVVECVRASTKHRSAASACLSD